MNLMLSTFIAAAAFGQGPTDLIAKVKSALSTGQPAWEQTLLTGKVEFYGLPSKFTIRFSDDGKYAQVVEGQIGEGFGYDGTTHWLADRTGATRITGFEDNDKRDSFNLILSGEWLDPNAPVELSSDGYTINVKLKKSGFLQKVEIDPATYLPKQSTMNLSSGLVALSLSDWRPVGDRKVPFKFDLNEVGVVDKYVVDQATPAKQVAYAIPAWSPKDALFTAPSGKLEAKKAISGHILVHPLVNGKDIGWFILDSGAEIMCIDPEAADSLKLPKIGKLPLVGVGGAITSCFRKSDDFQLGPLSLKNTIYAEVPLKQIGDLLKVKLAGIVGYDYFRRSIIALDLKTPTVEVYDPAKYTLPKGSWTQMWFTSGNPVVEAKFEGDRKAFFRLDTGANGTVVFHAPYTVQEKLLDKRETSLAGNGGVGGTTVSRLGRIEWFELGGHRFEKPAAMFSQAKSGAFADTYLAGNIGQEFMLPFTMVFDFGGSRVAYVSR